jgi:hypothetical protein
MKLLNQIILVNLLLVISIAVFYFLGYPMLIIVGCEAFFFLLVNLIFFTRIRRTKNQRG